MKFKIETLKGKQISPLIFDLAQLRIEIFKEYPYLYDGDIEYEKNYLKSYIECADSFLITVFLNGSLVGASTCLPLQCAAPEFIEPFQKNKLDVSKYFYFGESIMKKQYRGNGIYSCFFSERENYAKSLKIYSKYCFCAVDRGENHPDKPIDYISLENYWKKHGYIKKEKLTTFFKWRDVNENIESEKLMKFWIKDIINHNWFYISLLNIINKKSGILI